jgi:uncharacterized protein YlxW (UPF0749 family)
VNQYEFILGIIFIVMVASVLKTWLGGGRRHRRNSGDEGLAGADNAENARLRDEVKQLKERLAVLERITVEKENSLERQIEALRDQ